MITNLESGFVSRSDCRLKIGIAISEIATSIFVRAKMKHNALKSSLNVARLTFLYQDIYARFQRLANQ